MSHDEPKAGASHPDDPVVTYRFSRYDPPPVLPRPHWPRAPGYSNGHWRIVERDRTEHVRRTVINLLLAAV